MVQHACIFQFIRQNIGISGAPNVQKCASYTFMQRLLICSQLFEGTSSSTLKELMVCVESGKGSFLFFSTFHHCMLTASHQ